MNKESEERQEHMLEQAISSLRGTPVPAGPPAELTQAVIARLSAGRKQVQKDAVRERRWARLVAAAATVCAVAAVGWWLLGEHGAMPSAYAELKDAVDNSGSAEWMHVRKSSGGMEFEWWVGTTPARLFGRLGDRILGYDMEKGETYVYDPATRVLTVEKLGDASEADLKRLETLDLAKWYDEMLSELSSSGELTRRVEVIEGKERTVFTWSRKKPDRTTRIIVDAEAKRIIRTEADELLGHWGEDEPAVFTHDYPETGPADIYEVGVPRDARVVEGPAESTARVIGPHEGRSEVDIVKAAVLIDGHLKACRTYAATHRGEWPDSIEGLPGWLVYVKPSTRDLKADVASQIVVIYEVYDAWDTGAIVGFADTKVRIVRDEAEFNKLLARASGGAE